MASLSKIIDVHSHAILNIGQQVPRKSKSISEVSWETRR